MPTNIINLTNFITNTITNIVLETNIITSTNFTTETNSITSWSDPVLWFTGVGAGLTVLSAFLMYRSVQEMKLQREYEYRKQELSDLKGYVADNILVYVNESNNMIDKNITPVDRSIFDNGNDRIYSGLLRMGGLSNDTFYEKDFKEIWDQLVPLYSMIQYPKEYSPTIVIGIHQILTRVGADLYKALNHKPTHTELLECIKSFKDIIQNSMTPSDQQASIKHQEQFNHLINYIKTNKKQS